MRFKQRLKATQDLCSVLDWHIPPVELEAPSHAKSGTASVEVRKGQPPSGNSLEFEGAQGAQLLTHPVENSIMYSMGFRQPTVVSISSIAKLYP